MDLLLALKELKDALSSRRKDAYYSKKLDEFEALLADIKSTNDQEYTSKLYNNKNQTRAYKSLKYRMEERLANEIIDLVSEEDTLKSRITANIVIGKLFYIASVLQKKNYRNVSIPLYEKCFKLAEKFHYFAYALLSSEALANHYGFIAVDAKKMDYFLKKNQEFISLIEAENFAKECNTLISNIYVSNKGYLSQKNKDIMRNRIEILSKLKEKHKTYIIITYTNDLTFHYYHSTGNYKKALETAYQNLEEIKIENEKLSLFQSYRNIGITHSFLAQYDESTNWFLLAKDLPSQNSTYWFYITSLLYLNYIHLQDYDKLIKISIDVLSNKHLNKYPYFHEQWVIREAFLHFLIRAGKVKLSDSEKKSLRPFVLSRFVNSVPFHTKDKSGQNITIIVIQILFHLLDKKYDKIIDKIDSLTQYTYRYLKNDETLRSNCFIKMLLKMVAADFHPVRTKTYTEDLLKKLKKAQQITDEKNSQVEVIPYDYIWDVIMELL